MTEATAQETRPRACVTGADPDELFDVPFGFGHDDFRLAPDLQEIGDALVASCDEFADIRWAIEEQEISITYLWRKKAAKRADRSVAGSLAKAGGLIRYMSESDYIVQIAADVNYARSHWHMEALVFHELMHIKIDRELVGTGENIVEVPKLAVRAHDLEMFHAEVKRYGLWQEDLRKGEETFRQVPLFTAAEKRPDPDDAPGPAKRSRRSSTQVTQIARDLREMGATVHMGRSARS